MFATYGIDTTGNEPCQACPLSTYRSPRYVSKGQELIKLVKDDEGNENIFNGAALLSPGKDQEEEVNKGERDMDRMGTAAEGVGRPKVALDDNVSKALTDGWGD